MHVILLERVSVFVQQEHCLLSSDSLESFAFLHKKSSWETNHHKAFTRFSATKEDQIATVFNCRSFDFLGSSVQLLRAVWDKVQFLVRRGLFFTSRRRNRVLGLGLSNSEQGPRALDCPTTYNGRTRVTVGLGAVSKEVAQWRQWKRQLWVFTKAGPTVRQERGTAVPERDSSNPAAACPPRWLACLGKEIKALESPQATRSSESRGSTQSHTSNMTYVSHPSSSTSFGGAHPKASHTGPVPCKAERSREADGLCAVPTLSNHIGAPRHSQDQKHSSVVALGLLSLLGKAEPVSGQRDRSGRSRHLALEPLLPEKY